MESKTPHFFVFFTGTFFIFNIMAGGWGEGIGWRSDGTGKYLTATPPISFSSEQGIIWATPMPSWSNASPILVGQRLFVCSEPDILLCVDANTGEILWQKTNGYSELPDFADPAQMTEANKKAAELRREIARTQGEIWKLNRALKEKPEDGELKAQLQAAQEKLKALQSEHKAVAEAPYVLPRTHDVNGYSTPTPVSDGQYVYALFGHGVAACYDVEGHRRWIRFLEHPENEYGHSASPVLAEGKLIIHIRHLMALDPASGQTIWQIRLPESWGTLQIGRLGDTTIIATAAGDLVRASDGKILAQKLCKMDYGEPILAGDVIYYVQNEGKAFRLPHPLVEPFQPQLLWTTNIRKDRYYAASLLHEGLIYAVTQAGILSVVEAATGELIYEKNLQLPPVVYTAVTMADHYIYLCSEKGIIVIIEPGQQYEEVARLTLEPFRSVPVFTGTRMYVRTLQKLYCIGQ